MRTVHPSLGQAEAKIRKYLEQTNAHVPMVGDAAGMWNVSLCVSQQGRLTYLWAARPDSRADDVSLLRRAKMRHSLRVIHVGVDSVVSTIVKGSIGC